MASQSDGGSAFSSTSIPGLAILAILAAGIFTVRPTATGTRDAEPDKQSANESAPAEGVGTIIGKVPLWQDPYLALKNFKKTSDPEGQGYLKLLRDQLQSANNSHNHVRVLFVSTSSAVSPDAIEARIRSRQAVVGALRAEGFTLEHPDQIYYLAFSSVEKAGLQLAPAPPVPDAAPAPAPAAPSPTNRLPGKASVDRWLVTPVSYRMSWQDGGAGEVSATRNRIPLQPQTVQYESPKSASSGSDALSETLACELFSDDSVSRKAGWTNSLDYVLVVWLPEGLLNSQNGDDILRTLVRYFDMNVRASVAAPKNLLSYRLIGPFSSGTLRQLFQPSSANRNDSASELIPNLKIYSPSASSESFLLKSAVDPRDRDTAAHDPNMSGTLGSLGSEFSKHGPAPLVRTCASDDQIASSLIEEMRVRGLRIIPSSADASFSLANQDSLKLDNIALVCEHETLYGRGFAQTLNAVLWHQAMRDGKPYQERDERWRQLHSTCPSNVHIYYYPRNVNDRKPIDPSKLSSDAPPLPLPNSRKIVEYPEQASQLDYIRRLAVQLSHDYRTAGHNRLRAIGIIGSDLNDKLLLLQALRSEFPDILFFTTDLDARLFHQRNFAFTRSLVVASSFGLSLKDCYQRSSGFASFRDCFQTATYVACRLALTDDDQQRSRGETTQSPELQGTLHVNQVLTDLLTPRVFEIGRELAVCMNPPIQIEQTIHPVPKDDFNFGNWLLLLTTIGSSLALVTYVFPPFRDRLSVFMYGLFRFLRVRDDASMLRHRREPEPWEKKVINRQSELQQGIVILSTVLFIVLIIVIALSHGLQGEPFSIFSGISSWPGVVLGVLSLILSMSFLVQAWFMVRHTDLRFSNIYQLGTADGEVRRRARLFPLSLWEPAVTDSKINIGATWRQYLAFSELSNRVFRVGGMGLVFLVFWVAIFGLFGAANEPYRGALNALVGRVVFDLSLVALTLLTLFVVDATSLSLQFIRHLSRHQSEYDEATLTHFWTQNFTDPSVPGVAAQATRLKRIAEFVDMSLIAEQTTGVFQLITYPFISLTLLILSRSNFFDNYVPSMLIIFVFGVLFAYVVWCAIMLQRAAARTKLNSIATLRRQLSAVRLAASPGALTSEIQILESAIAQIENMRQGALVPFQENPIVRAILLPFGGTALVPAIDMISKLM